MSFEPDELNEIGTLLHITESIATNHPNLKAIARLCMQRLNEIEAECKEVEAEEAEAAKQAEAERQAQEYQPPTPDSPDYVPSEDGEPAAITEPAPVERRV